MKALGRSGVACAVVLLTGCFADQSTSEPPDETAPEPASDPAAISSNGGLEFLASAEPGVMEPSADGLALTLMPGDGLLVYHLLDKAIAVRDGDHARVEFEIPAGADVNRAFARVTAYNDDATYTRAVWFQLDGNGGYLGTVGIGPHDVGGQGVLDVKQTKHWAYDLDEVDVGHTLSDQEQFTGSFLDVLRRDTRHVVEAWVSTYAQFGPGSWVSLDLFLAR
jgi:hypothetical protein